MQEREDIKKKRAEKLEYNDRVIAQLRQEGEEDRKNYEEDRKEYEEDKKFYEQAIARLAKINENSATFLENHRREMRESNERGNACQSKNPVIIHKKEEIIIPQSDNTKEVQAVGFCNKTNILKLSGAALAFTYLCGGIYLSVELSQTLEPWPAGLSIASYFIGGYGVVPALTYCVYSRNKNTQDVKVDNTLNSLGFNLTQHQTQEYTRCAN